MEALLRAARRAVHNAYGTTPHHTRSPAAGCRDDCIPCGLATLAAEVVAADFAARKPTDRMAVEVGNALASPTVPCKNCSQQYDPADDSDPYYGKFVGPRYCGPCGAQEARIAAAEMGWE